MVRFKIKAIPFRKHFAPLMEEDTIGKTPFDTCLHCQWVCFLLLGFYGPSNPFPFDPLTHDAKKRDCRLLSTDFWFPGRHYWEDSQDQGGGTKVINSTLNKE